MEATFSQETPYENLSPSKVLDAVETLGSQCTGAVFALNSYENRVYDIALEGRENIVAKFYRPHRWTKEQILEEHQFAEELQEAEVDVVPPVTFGGETLFEYDGYWFCIYPKRAGHPIELSSDEDYRHMGRLIARMHQVGVQHPFAHRLVMTPQNYGRESVQFLNDSGCVPEDLRESYATTAEVLLQKIEAIWGERKFYTRIHGDCHWGNIFKHADVFFVDLDDALTGPEVQDLWMMVSGDAMDRGRQFDLVLEGYNQIRDFDYSQMNLVEPLRSLRMIYMAAWIGRRWEDPAFSKRFTEFQTSAYWQNHILDLREQIALLDEVMAL